MRLDFLTYHFGLRSLSVVMAVLYFIWGPKEDALSMAVAVLAFLPVSGEKAAFSFRFALFSSLALIIPLPLGIGAGLPVVFSLILLMAYSAVSAVGRYSRLRGLFNNNAIWSSVEIQARSFYFTLLATVDCTLLCLKDYGLWMSVSEALLSLLYALMMYRSYTGRTLFLSRRKEIQLRNLIRGDLRIALPDEDYAEDTVRMNILYNRIVNLMETGRPYLDEYYSLDDLSKTVCSNRTLVSKTINIFSGRNFCQFVNYYRVSYSVELAKKDPRLKVKELASMSGFHSSVTFTLAFKLNRNDTPANFLKKIKLGNLKLPSSPGGVAQSVQSEFS